MQIFVFILLAGVWAAFLLPSFFESRKSAPVASTRSFARTTELLATAANAGHREVLARRRTLARRRRALVALGAGALVALAMAVWKNSVTWLTVALLFDLGIAAYVTLLLQIKQQRSHRAPVVPIPVERDRAATGDTSSVRVVAG